MIKLGENGNYGWLGARKERKAKEVLYSKGQLIDFSQWTKTENDLTIEGFDFPFDDGYAFWVINEHLQAELPPGPQTVGNCVPYGSCLANYDRILTELLFFGEAEQRFVPFVPYSYGAGRVYVGNVNWSSDGSIGSWQIEADMQDGLLPCDCVGLPVRYEDDMQGSASTNHEWMKSRSTLDKWKPQAVELTVGEGSEINSFDELKIAVVNKKQSVTIASNYGFRSKGLDSKYGIVIHVPSGTWSHQMHIRAVFCIKGQWFVYVGNQWGDKYHPKVADGFALGGFVIFAEVFDSWVKNAECFVRGSINGRTLKPNFAFI